MNNSGSLYIIGTPIGNLEDITLRALKILSKLDIIIAENPRHSRILLSHYKIAPSKIVCYNEYNKQRVIPEILNFLRKGMNVGLITDGGTPCISDPGYHLTKAILDNKLKIVPIPGVSALITALSVAGVPADKFLFYGFLPKKSSKRRKILDEIKTTEKTVVIYESPHRLLKLLVEIKEIIGNIQLIICRELTKIYEEIKKDYVENLIQFYLKTAPKGEFVIVISSKGQ